MNYKIFLVLLIVTISLAQEQRNQTQPRKYKQESRNHTEYEYIRHYEFKSKHIVKIGFFVGGSIIGLLLLRRCIIRRKLRKQMRKQKRLMAQQAAMIPQGYPLTQGANQPPAFYAVSIQQFELFQKWLQTQNQQIPQQPLQNQQQPQQPFIQQGQPFPYQQGVAYPQFQQHFEIQQPNIRVQQ